MSQTPSPANTTVRLSPNPSPSNLNSSWTPALRHRCRSNPALRPRGYICGQDPVSWADQSGPATRIVIDSAASPECRRSPIGSS